MILKKFNYSEFTDKPNSWSLDGLDLENINLLVGKNATGKTNTLMRILWLSRVLAGKQPQLYDMGNYVVEFTHNNIVYLYKLNLLSYSVEYEELFINGEQQFKRGNDGIGEIFADELGKKIKFQLSPNQLVVTSKRDAIQHPFLEELVKWAEGLRKYNFGSDMGKNALRVVSDINSITVDPSDPNSAMILYYNGEQEFPETFPKLITDAMESIGYELNSIKVNPLSSHLLPTDVVGTGFVLCIREKDSSTDIPQHFISQGMFRALSLIIQITYNTLKKLSTTILIDDIGEGLDFDRSTKLINLLIELAEKDNNIQLIMSTNDRFVMNNVPLKYWQVIQRNGGHCKVSNYKGSPEIFEEFKYTGLNNFDFFATDFINSEWEQK
jgi:hypothetical protein